MSRTKIKAPSLQTIRKAVQLALDEDLDHGDVTTSALFPRSIQARAAILAHQPMTVAGVAVAREVFLAVDPSLRIVKSINDGATVKPGTEVIFVRGDVRSWLMAERVAVNFLQRLSGIATLTAKSCAAIRHTETAILDTRKTTPGLRALEKYAVTLGGGKNHRFGLYDGCASGGQAARCASHHLRIGRKRRELPSLPGWL